jgi:formylglycine-generating enzyme required for sulfatase activity
MNVSWDGAVNFCRWLSKEMKSEVRLPNEAEWEYAALGGNESKGYKFSGSNNWNDVSWSEGNSGARTQPVGGKKPNELGLYDMSGNVWEMCEDWPTNNMNKSQSDRKRSENGDKHAVRGNSFDNPASDPRLPAARVSIDTGHYNLGFRIAKTR